MLADRFRGVGRMKRFAAFTASALTMVTLVALAGFAVAEPASGAATPTSLAVSATPADSGDLRTGEALRLVLTVTNQSDLTSSASTATVSLGDTAFSSRGTLSSWFDATLKTDLATRRLSTAPIPPLPPGATQTVAVTIPASSVRLGVAGVYPVSVTATNGSETTIPARTAIAWNVTSTKPVPLVLAAPLTVAASNTAFISAKVLADDTAPGGLLTRQLDDLSGTSAAIGIDPRILASIRILGKSVPPSAWAWLQQLTQVKNQTFPLAWADADLTAPLQAGESTVLATPPLDYAINPSNFLAAGNTSTPNPTGTPTPQQAQLPTSESLTAFDYTLPELAWPRANTVINADLPKLAASGLSTMILSSSNVTEPTPDGLLGAAAKVGGASVAVSDSTLSDYLTTAVESPSRADSAAATTELATTLALIGLQSGSHPKVTLASVARNWGDFDTNFDRTISALNSRPWSSAAGITDVFGASRTTVKVTNSPQPAARISAVSGMIAAENGQAQFSVIADDPAALTSSRRLLLLALLSNEWLGDSTTWASEVTSYLDQTRDIVESVQIVALSRVNIVADSASLPIKVSNSLDQGVTVYLVVTPTTPLVSVDKDHRFQEVTVAANSQKLVQIPVQALSNGKAKLVAILYSSTRRQIGHSQTIDVNVQAGWEVLGTFIFAALVLAVFAFGIIRTIGKRRKARRGEIDSEDEDSESVKDDA